MMRFITENKDVLTFSVSVLGILLALCFGSVLNWRQKICLDYESRRDVAINILRDRFVQRTVAHYAEVADERRRKKTELEEIYRRPEQQEMIRDQASTLEEMNRVKRCFRRLDFTSHTAFVSLWASIVLAACPLVGIWVCLPTWLGWAWGVFVGIAFLVFVSCVTALCFLDGRFFSLVNRIIEPEGE